MTSQNTMSSRPNHNHITRVLLGVSIQIPYNSLYVAGQDGEDNNYQSYVIGQLVCYTVLQWLNDVRVATIKETR